MWVIFYLSRLVAVEKLRLRLSVNETFGIIIGIKEKIR